MQIHKTTSYLELPVDTPVWDSGQKFLLLFLFNIKIYVEENFNPVLACLQMYLFLSSLEILTVSWDPVLLFLSSCLSKHILFPTAAYL